MTTLNETYTVTFRQGLADAGHQALVQAYDNYRAAAIDVNEEIVYLVVRNQNHGPEFDRLTEQAYNLKTIMDDLEQALDLPEVDFT